MSQQIATKSGVKAALEKILAATGVKATADQVLEEVRGSKTTVIRYMQELEREAEVASNPPGTLADYQALCRKLDASGRLARQPEIDLLSQDLHATRQELDALRHIHTETEAKHQEALVREAVVQEKLNGALEMSGIHAGKLVALQSEHGRVVNALHRKLESALRKNAKPRLTK